MTRSSRHEVAEHSRSPRTTRRSRADFSGLDVGPDDDDVEYGEAETSKDNVEEDFEEQKPRRGTKRKIVDDDKEDDDPEVEQEPVAEPEDDFEEEEEEEEAEEAEEEVEVENTDKANSTPVKKIVRKPGLKKRGRKKLEVVFSEEGVFDEDGNPIDVAGDEVIIENEDPKGKAKVDEDGYLRGGREYRNKTFTVLNSGKRLYMISTDPARLVGFRDSYLLFKTHRTLFKRICNEEEKTDLIERGLIPNSYKGRSVNLVAARSIFREFGAKVLRNGKKVIDDFWEDRAIKNGDIPGAYADPLESIKNPIRSALTGDSGTGGVTTPVTSTPLISYQTDPTWLYKVALQVKDYNRKLLDNREAIVNRGIKDLYTNFTFFPAHTQPSRTKRRVISKSGDDIVQEIQFSNPDIRRKVTGLKDVPKDIFEGVDEETRRAILDQQEFERTL